MKPVHYEELRQLDRDYWWFVTRYRMAWRLIREGRPSASPWLADIGCGTGGFLLWLAEQGLVPADRSIGVEADSHAASIAADRGLRIVQASADLPIDSRHDAFDVMTMMDVLEHIEKPQDALVNLRRHIKPGGSIVVLVPALPVLWSPWDEHLGHFRRYTRATLTASLESAGWQVRRTQYLFATMTVPALARARLIRQQTVSESEFPRVPKWANRALTTFCTTESYLGSFLPFGTSVAAVARNPDT